MAEDQTAAERVRAVMAVFEGHEGSPPYAAMKAIPVDAPETVAALLTGLTSSAWRGALACTEALGRASCSRKEAGAGLLEALIHAQPSVRRGAAEALGTVAKGAGNAAEAAQALERMMLAEVDLGALRECLRAMGGTGARVGEAVDLLCGLLEAAAGERSARQAWNEFRRRRGVPLAGKRPEAASYVKDGEFDDDFRLMEGACDSLKALLAGPIPAGRRHGSRRR